MISSRSNFRRSRSRRWPRSGSASSICSSTLVRPVRASGERPAVSCRQVSCAGACWRAWNASSSESSTSTPDGRGGTSRNASTRSDAVSSRQCRPSSITRSRRCSKPRARRRASLRNRTGARSPPHRRLACPRGRRPCARRAGDERMMAADGTVYLVRHGQTALNAASVLRGRLDPPLDAVGLREARALGETFAGVRLAAVVTSPLARARATGEPIAASDPRPAPSGGLEGERPSVKMG